jgi:hypothetical protein
MSVRGDRGNLERATFRKAQFLGVGVPPAAPGGVSGVTEEVAALARRRRPLASEANPPGEGRRGGNRFGERVCGAWWVGPLGQNPAPSPPAPATRACAATGTVSQGERHSSPVGG